jgi:DNA-binding transcriptional MerR regulator
MTKMMNMPIGRLAKSTDVKVTTIRFYEQIGLLPEPSRTQSDRRVYDEASVRRLAFIKHARQLGFSVDAILDLADHPERACEAANTIAQEQLQAVEAKIAQLEALRVELGRMVSARCSGPAAQCRVIESLGNHDLCAQDHATADRVSV